jgi:hypothetical protein
MRQTIMHYLAGNPAVTSIKHDDMDAMHSLTQTIV